MAIIVLKRTRTYDSTTEEYSSWSDWASTTDAAPFTNTTTTEYKIDSQADIVLDDLTNGALGEVSNEWTGTGVFDVLIAAVNKNIEGQYNKGRISGTDYANVYLGSMQAVVAQSVQYLLQEKITEAQIDGLYADNEIKSKQLELTEEELAIKREELKTVYVDRIIKDKEAANLGLDDVLKIAKTRKADDTTYPDGYVYRPYYVETV